MGFKELKTKGGGTESNDTKYRAVLCVIISHKFATKLKAEKTSTLTLFGPSANHGNVCRIGEWDTAESQKPSFKLREKEQSPADQMKYPKVVSIEPGVPDRSMVGRPEAPGRAEETRAKSAKRT
ncbi:hypothetical protein B0H13DRAFT_1860945 [Mycena leptocephala]|nr:hypothetical protein B0H13DRAFT_1860945 [Mycena leptocephala]